MYSRSFGTFEDLSSINQSRMSEEKRVPVRVYGDNYAFERFSKLGENEAQSEEQISFDKEDVTSDSADDTPSHTEPTPVEKDIGLLERILEKDTMIILLSALTVIMCREKNDRITPICLLLIMLL